MKNLLVLEIPTNEAREPKNRMQIQLETPKIPTPLACSETNRTKMNAKLSFKKIVLGIPAYALEKASNLSRSFCLSLSEL